MNKAFRAMRARLAWRRWMRRYRVVAGRTRRRITETGILVLAGYAVALLFVINTRSSMNYQLFSLLLAVFIAAHLAGLSVRVRGLRVERRAPVYGAVGAPVEYTLRLTNEGLRAQQDLLLFENARLENEDDSFWESWTGLAEPISAAPTLCAQIRPGETLELQACFTPLQRGVVSLDGVSVGAPDPLGLFRNTLRVPAQDRILILPKRYPLKPYALSGGRRRQPEGLRLSTSAGDGGDFSSLRDFRPGDPLRSIHWPSSARSGRLVVKELEDAYCIRRALILDTFLDPARLDDMNSARFEAAVTVAASFAAAPQLPDAVMDLLLVADKARVASAGRGLGDAARLLEALACVTPRFDQNVALLQASVHAHAPRISGAVCVFLEWDKARRDLVASLLGRGVDALVLLIAPPRRSAAPLLSDPGPLAGRPGRFHVLRADSLEEGLAGI